MARHARAELEPLEAKLFESHASFEPAGFVASGRLVLTPTQLLFIPDEPYRRMPFFRGRPYLVCDLHEVRSVLPSALGTGSYLGGHQRTGLEIRLTDGFTMRFGVDDTDEWVRTIRGAAPPRPPERA